MNLHNFFLSITVASFAATACTSTSPTVPLPTLRSPAGDGRIASSKAVKTGHSLRVGGRVRPVTAQPQAHVDIQVIGADGAVIAEATDRLRPMQPGAGGGRRALDSYVASFHASVARDAVAVRIVYRNGPHAGCNQG
jgi:hypothetical protein